MFANVGHGKGGRMTSLHIPQMPDEPKEIAKWLERFIAGPGLGDLVDELMELEEPVYPDQARSNLPREDTALGEKLEKVLGTQGIRSAVGSGLSSLRDDQVCSLLEQPLLLFELQERILSTGSPYWKAKLDRWEAKLRENKVMSDITERCKARLLEKIHSDERISPLNKPESTITRPELPPPMRNTWFMAGVLTAVAVMLVIGILIRNQFDDSARGRNVADVFQPGLSRSDNLKLLAAFAKEWSLEKPRTPDEMSMHLLQFREVCSRIIVLGTHDKWLVERCGRCAQGLDKQLIALESGKKNVDVIQKEMDIAIEKLLKDLDDQEKQEVKQPVALARGHLPLSSAPPLIAPMEFMCRRTTKMSKTDFVCRALGSERSGLRT
jgi:hypothetical protein